MNPPIRDITQEITQSPSQWTNTTGLPLTIPDGFSCNVCVESDWRRAKMLVANADGKGEYDFLSGFSKAMAHPEGRWMYFLIPKEISLSPTTKQASSIALAKRKRVEVENVL